MDREERGLFQNSAGSPERACRRKLEHPAIVYNSNKFRAFRRGLENFHVLRFRPPNFGASRFGAGRLKRLLPCSLCIRKINVNCHGNMIHVRMRFKVSPGCTGTNSSAHEELRANDFTGDTSRVAPNGVLFAGCLFRGTSYSLLLGASYGLLLACLPTGCLLQPALCGLLFSARNSLSLDRGAFRPVCFGGDRLIKLEERAYRLDLLAESQAESLLATSECASLDLNRFGIWIFRTTREASRLPIRVWLSIGSCFINIFLTNFFSSNFLPRNHSLSFNFKLNSSMI